MVSGAGGRCADTVNGTYTQERMHNGKPLYKKVGGKSIIYFAGKWKINDEGSTGGWYYSHPSTASSVPTEQWTTEGYSGSDVLPPPSLSLQASSGTTTGSKASLDAIIVKGSDKQLDCDGVYVRE